MFDYQQLLTLAAILRHGSFDGAAGELNITQSAVSQRLRALEDRVGEPLIVRASPCRGTELGRRLANHVAEVGLMEARLAADMGLDAPTPRIRIAVNADSLAAWIVPALAQAQQEVGALLFDVLVDDQDHSADWLRRGEVAAAVTAQPDPPVGCDSLPLGALRYVATASPAFMTRHFPDGVTAEALAQAPMLTFNHKDRLQLDWLARHIGPKVQPPTHFLPSTQAFIDAAQHGLGWGMNPEPLVKKHILAGELVPLLPDAEHETPLFWQVPRRLNHALAPLTRAMRQSAARHLS